MNPFLFRDRGSLLHRLDPRAKILALLLSFVAVTVQPLSQGVFLLAALILIWAALGKALFGVRRIAVILISIMVITTLIWGLMKRELGLFSLSSLMFGFVNGMKIDAMIISGVAFLASTRHEEVGCGLQRLGLPYRVTFVLSMAMRLVPVFTLSGYTVIQAQTARGLDLSGGSPVVRVRRYLALLTPLLLSALRVSGPLTQALESRGFSRSGRSSLIELRWRCRDTITVLIWFVIAALCVWMAVS